MGIERPPYPTVPGHELCTTDQAAAYLGRSNSWLHKLRAGGQGPRFVRVGKSVLYRKADLDSYLESCVVDPADEYAANLEDTRRKLNIISRAMLDQFPDEPAYIDPAATYQAWFDDWRDASINNTPESLLEFFKVRARAVLGGAA